MPALKANSESSVLSLSHSYIQVPGVGSKVINNSPATVSLLALTTNGSVKMFLGLPGAATSDAVSYTHLDVYKRQVCAH